MALDQEREHDSGLRPAGSRRPVSMAGSTPGSRSFLRTAAPGSDLAAWHEAGNLAAYPSRITTPARRVVHPCMDPLCSGSLAGLVVHFRARRVVLD